MTTSNTLIRFGILSLLLPAMARAEEPLTTKEMMALSARAADKRVRADLLSILRPRGRISRGMRVYVGDTWMHTKAYATKFKGLCQRNTLSLYYAPTEKIHDDDWHKRGANAPVRPYRIETSTSYKFVRPPRPDDVKLTQDEKYNAYYHPPFDPACGAADRGENEWDGWVSAVDPETAMTGALAIPAVKQWSSVKEHEFEGCKENEARCKAKVLMFLDLGLIRGFGTCEAPKGEICLGIGEFTVRARQAREILKAEDIISVSHEFEIVVT